MLLMSNHQFLADAAETFCRQNFNVLYSNRRSRRDNQIDDEMKATIKNHDVDYIFSFLSPIVIPASFLEQVHMLAINFHPAPPKWPGVGSPSYAIFHGDESFGVTAHIMEQKVDAGKIIDVLRFPIQFNDTCETLFNRTLTYSIILFYQVLTSIKLSPELQFNGEEWERDAIRRSEFEEWMTVDADDEEEIIQKKIRALSHSLYPGPFLKYEGRIFELADKDKFKPFS